VEVRSNSGACVVIDAGTGLRALGEKLAEEQGSSTSWRHHIILSHVHWDHIQGLPFFEPAYIKGTHISIHALRVAADELRHVVGGITRHEFFPVPLDSVPADFKFNEVQPGKAFRISDLEILPFSLNHPFGSVGYRISADGTSLAYVSDTAPFDYVLHKQHFLAGPEEPTAADREVLARLRADLVDALLGTDTVIYDTHFLPEEYQRFPHYGHSTPDHALELLRGTGVARLVLFHHAPSHDDQTMDEVEARYRQRGTPLGIDVVAARERMVLRVGGRHPTNPGVGP
jgi:phosphoribosyl 1,2-cyclic phosphodiesterase